MYHICYILQVRADVRVTGEKDELVQGFLIGGITVGLGYIGINAVFVSFS